MTDSYHIGIDISKAWFDVFINPLQQHTRYPNTLSGRQALLKTLHSLSTPDTPIALIVFEASGGYERPLRQCLSDAGYPHACVQPMRVHSYLKAQGHKAKTDKLDAQALAAFAAAGMVRASRVQDKDMLALRDMLRCLETIRAYRANITCQIEKCADQTGAGVDALNALLDGVKREDAQLLAQIKAFVKSRETLSKSVQQLSSVPGVGFYTACVLLAELPELGTCCKAQIAALTGTAPYTRQSGQWSGKAMIAGGRHYARKALYMAALTASRYNPDLKKIYDRLRQSGKPYKVAIVAIMRHMVIILNAMMKTNTLWTPKNTPNP